MARPTSTPLRDAIAGADEGDAVLLHGCCHNPTGIDYTNEQWDEIAAAAGRQRVLPVIDLAYQGLGHGMDEDAYGVRTVLAAVPEALVAYSCDKNFGLYRDRVGALYAMAKEHDDIGRIMSNGLALARADWSMPPDHGAAAVRLVLREELTEAWLDELEQMRARIRQVRATLAAAGKFGSVDLAPLGKQNGMFAMLALARSRLQAAQGSRDLHGRLGPHQRRRADDGQHPQVHRGTRQGDRLTEERQPTRVF